MCLALAHAMVKCKDDILTTLCAGVMFHSKSEKEQLFIALVGDDWLSLFGNLTTQHSQWLATGCLKKESE